MIFQEINKNYLKILGSVSPYSNANNNCPGYMLNINEEKILLDCGPGVCKKLQIPDDFKNLNIFISHFHKDHYTDLLAIGYASFVYHKLGLLEERIKVYIPKTNKEDYEYIDYLLVKDLKEQFFEIIEYDENSMININNIIISFMENHHSIKCFSTKIEYDNKKMVYTADLGYKSSTDLINFAKEADILLIESTFLDDEIEEYHLNVSQSANIAKMINCKKLLLTHFWPQINPSEYETKGKEIFENTISVIPDMIINL